MPHYLHILCAVLMFVASIEALEDDFASSPRFQRRYSAANTTFVLDSSGLTSTSTFSQSLPSSTSLSSSSLQNQPATALPTVSLRVGPPRSSDQHPVFSGFSTIINQTTSTQAESSTPGRHSFPASGASGASSTKIAPNASVSAVSSYHGLNSNQTSKTYQGTGSPNSSCSSYLTICPGKFVIPVTSTINLMNETITITAGAPSPPPTLIFPPPLCGTVTARRCRTTRCDDCIQPAVIGATQAQLFTILVTKKSTAVVTASAPPISLIFGPQAQQTMTKSPSLAPSTTPILVPILDHTAIEKGPTPGVDTRITTSFATEEISTPTNAPTDQTPVAAPGSGDASAAAAGGLAGIASVIAAPSGNAMVALSRVPAALKTATNTNPAVAAPSKIAAANIPTSIEPSPAVVDSPTLAAGATLKTLIVPPALTSSFVAAAVTYNGQKFSINPSEFIAPTATIALTAQSQVVVYQEQSFTLNPSQFVAPGTIIPIPAVTASPILSPVTVGSITFSLGPSAAIIGSSTYLFSPGQPPLTTVLDGQTIHIGANGIGFASTTVAIPTAQTFPTGLPVVADGIKIDVGSNKAIISGTTYAIGSGANPQTVVIDTETLTFGPSGVGLPSTTILPYYPPTVPSPVVVDGLTFSIDATKAIISGITYAIGSGATPQTVVIGTETLTFGPSGVSLPSTTILPYLPLTVPSPVVVNGLTFSIDATKAIISGTTYAIGSGATLQTVVIGTETLTFGPDGVGLPSTTILPHYSPTVPSPVVVDGLTFSIDATEAIISGTTYAIGPGAVPKTVVIGTETLTFGPDGVGLPSTTMLPHYPLTVPSPVVVDGLTFSIDATEAIISGTTYAIGPGAVPKTVVIGTETLTFGPDGVGLPSTTMLPHYPLTVPSPVVVDGLTFSIDATEAIISGTTYAIGPGAVPKTVVIGTETLTFGPNGVDLPSTTIPPYYPPTVPSLIVIDGLTFSIDATEAIISGTTYAIGPGAVPKTIVIGSETISIGPGGVGLPETTLVPPSLPSLTPTPVTADGLTFSIDPSDVVIAGSTYAIGSGAPTETLVVAGETVVIGPGGVSLRATTVAPPVTATPVTVDGIVFSIEPTEVVVGGSTFAIGSGAPVETLVVAGETVRIGPGGVGLISTTLAAPGAGGTGSEVSTGGAAVSKPVVRMVGGVVCFLVGVLVL